MKNRRLWLVAMLLCLLAPCAWAAGWTIYANERYGYSIAIPPGFSSIAESDNGDGGVSTSADGKATLSVWGSLVTEGGFAGEIAWRIDQDKAAGWRISYEKRGARAASWSGSKGGRVIYVRSIKACDGAAAYFQLEYDSADLSAYDAVVGRLVKSLKSGC